MARKVERKEGREEKELFISLRKSGEGWEEEGELA